MPRKKGKKWPVAKIVTRGQLLLSLRSDDGCQLSKADMWPSQHEYSRE